MRAAKVTLDRKTRRAGSREGLYLSSLRHNVHDVTLSSFWLDLGNCLAAEVSLLSLARLCTCTCCVLRDRKAQQQASRKGSWEAAAVDAETDAIDQSASHDTLGAALAQLIPEVGKSWQEARAKG